MLCDCHVCKNDRNIRRRSSAFIHSDKKILIDAFPDFRQQFLEYQLQILICYRTKGIDGYISTVAKKFSDVELAHSYLIEVRKIYPRYMRDQLQMISKPFSKVDSIILNEALQECVKRRLYSASEFQDMIDYINRQR